MPSNKLDGLSNPSLAADSVFALNPSSSPTLASNPWDPDITESNLMAFNALPLCSQTQISCNEEVRATAVVPSSSETQVPRIECVQVSTTTLLPSETQA